MSGLSFPGFQSRVLPDINDNETPHESSVYDGYANVGSNGQDNGLSDHQDTDHTDTALLERLLEDYDRATSEHSKGLDFPTGNGPSSMASHDNFASFLQAVATTRKQANIAQSREVSLLQSRSSQEPFFKRSFPPEAPASNPSEPKFRQPGNFEEDAGLELIRIKRRKLQDIEKHARARERELWGSDDDEGEEDSGSNQDYTPSDTVDIIGLGIQSATALFRKPSAASERYTRPVMSKMFTSLELSPEEFVHLQAAAKAFMLDENHTDRFDCVGERGDKGHIDMTKLKLFSCAEEFLDGEGWGERCYGVNAVEDDRKKLKWPQMKPKIISLVVPLLRRMVANEKQRRYAVQTRAVKSRKRPKKLDQDQESVSASPSTDSPQPAIQNGLLQSVERSDTSVNQVSYELDSAGRSPRRDTTPTLRNRTSRESLFLPGENDKIGVQYQVSIMQNGRRIKPRFKLTPESCPGFASLIQYIQSMTDDGGQVLMSVKVLGPSGLVDVLDDEGWMEVIQSIKDCVWMDGDAKCVAQVKNFSETL